MPKKNKSPTKRKPSKKVASSRPKLHPRRKAAPGATLAKQLASVTSTSGAGHDFEIDVQTTFAVLMLADGVVPCVHNCKIEKLKVQGSYQDFKTDDMIVYAKDRMSGRPAKLLAQIKRTIDITARDLEFAKVIKAAWSDFTNPAIFNQETDHFALITSLISQADIRDTRTILEWARHAEDERDFVEKVNKARFSSGGKRKKLLAFHQQLAAANDGNLVSDKQLWEFMKRFHVLGYDLDIKSGVTLSLVRSLIAQYPSGDVEALRLKVAEEVRAANRNAGVITLESIQEDIRQAFTRREEKQMPAALKPVPTSSTPATVAPGMPIKQTVIAQLLGSWNEALPGDIAIVEEIAGTDYQTFISPLREALTTPNPAMRLRDGVWDVADRLAIWDAFGPQVFDDQLDRLQDVARKVLLERDPQFDLEPDKRYAAQIYGKKLSHSGQLRHGLATTLALLLNRKQPLTNTRHEHAEEVARRTVATVLEAADWVIWASVKSFLPTFAEAAPEQFLDAVDEALNTDPCPFDELFEQEGNGITGTTYISGLLSALETLAWEEKYLPRAAVQLAELAERDKGGKYTNRPDHSLATIFLPWYPQTTAPLPAQLAAMRAIAQEDKAVAWKVLMQLLPNALSHSSGTSKPMWRRFADITAESLTNLEYMNRVTEFAHLAVELAKEDDTKLVDLVNHLDVLPLPVFKELLGYLESDAVRQLGEEHGQAIADRLLNLINKHIKFAKAEWAMPADIVKQVQGLADTLQARDRRLNSRRFFSNNDYELVNFEGDYQAQFKALEDQRKQAMADIIVEHGLNVAIEFARGVPSPWHAAVALGLNGGPEADSVILPAMLSTDKDFELARGYIAGRISIAGWSWMDSLKMDSWTREQVGKFFSILPFNPETWDRAERVLGADEGEYWRRAPANMYAGQTGGEHVVEKLVKYDRPLVAASCVYMMKQQKLPFDGNKVCDILIAGGQSTEPVSAGDGYRIVELIKALQNDPTVEQGKLFTVEWLYIGILDRHQQAFPKTLERVMASDPAAFMQVMSLVYRSKNAPKREPTEQERRQANQAYQLLRNWSTVPGMQPDGAFNADAFTAWLAGARRLATEAGLLEAALSVIGQILSHAPAGPDDLWINEVVARVLDGKNAKKIRDGYRVAVMNSRGAHWVDPEGKPELALAAEFDRKAKTVEDLGFARFGATLKLLADMYRREAADIKRRQDAIEGTDS